MNDVTETITTSAAVASLAAALTKAQSSMGRSRQTDLASVQTAIGKALAENGLSYIQRAHDKPGHISVETILLHESGESISSGILSMPVSAEMDLTSFGSTISAVRTHSLASAFGITPVDLGTIAASVDAPAVGTAKDQLKLDQNVETKLQPKSNEEEILYPNAAIAADEVVSVLESVAPVIDSTAKDDAAADCEQKEAAQLTEKIETISKNCDVAWLKTLSSRVNNLFELQSNRVKFLNAVDKRIAELTPSAAIAA